MENSNKDLQSISLGWLFFFLLAYLIGIPSAISQVGQPQSKPTTQIRSSSGHTLQVLSEDEEDFVVDVNGQRKRMQKPKGWNEIMQWIKDIAHPEETIKKMESEIAAHPGEAKPYEKLGDFFAFMDQYSKAIDEYSQAASLKPDDGELLKKKAFAEIRRKKYLEGLQTLTEVLKLLPEDAESLEWLGDVYLLSEEMDKAQEPYKKALTNAGPRKEKLEQKIDDFKLLQIKNQTDEDHLKKIIWRSRSFQAKFSINEAMYSAIEKEKGTEGLIEFCKNAIKEDSQNIEAAIRLADVYRRSQNYVSAIETLNKALETDPHSEYALLAMAVLYNDLQNQEKAGAYVDKVLKIYPDSASAYYNLGRLQQMKKNYPLALAHFNHSKQINPHDVFVLISLARLYYQMKNYPGAAQNYEDYLKLKPNDVEATNNLGAIYWYLRDIEKARYYLNRALTIDPSYEPAKINLRKMGD